MTMSHWWRHVRKNIRPQLFSCSRKIPLYTRAGLSLDDEAVHYVIRPDKRLQCLIVGTGRDHRGYTCTEPPPPPLPVWHLVCAVVALCKQIATCLQYCAKPRPLMISDSLALFYVHPMNRLNKLGCVSPNTVQRLYGIWFHSVYRGLYQWVLITAYASNTPNHSPTCFFE